NAELHKALSAALKEARAPEVRAVILTGAGRGFCVGQDLTEFGEAPGDIGARLRGNYHPNILAIRALEKPVIAAVNGAAAGAGLSFACACDLRIAASSARRARSSGSPRGESSAQPTRMPGGSCQKSSTRPRLRVEPPSLQRSSP